MVKQPQSSRKGIDPEPVLAAQPVLHLRDTANAGLYAFVENATLSG
jgi:hypothetical protein